jgi:hypothetical protein
MKVELKSLEFPTSFILLKPLSFREHPLAEAE